MSKHTPGPWEVEEGAGEIVICAETGTAIDESICFVTHGGWHEMPRETAIANARLISAAPELLEALRSVLPYVVTDVLEHCDGNKCREQWCAGCFGQESAEAAVADANAKYKAACVLLAKATGESP